MDTDLRSSAVADQSPSPRTVFDVIVCGAGTAGSVLASRIATATSLQVLLLEAGGSDDVPAVQDPWQWPTNLGTERAWNFTTTPAPALNDHPTYYPMGKGLGGGGSINATVWARGHRADWDSYAHSTGEPAWGYQNVLKRYRNIERYLGPADPLRGTSGTMTIERLPLDHPFYTAVQTAAQQHGIPERASLNGALMEEDAGTGLRDADIHDDVRQSPYRSYLHPLLPRENLTVLTGAEVDRVLFDGRRADSVLLTDGRQFQATRQIVLSLGAINTPTVLLRPGIGDQTEFQRLGINTVHHQPSVGTGLHDHINLPVVFHARADAVLPPPARAAVGLLWNLEDPDGYAVAAYVDTRASVAGYIAVHEQIPKPAVTFVVGIRLRSRGRVRLTSARAEDAPIIEPGWLEDPADLPAVLRTLDTVSYIGNHASLAAFLGSRAFPPASADRDAEIDYIRNGIQTFWHQSGTAAMGADDTFVLDPQLRVRGVDSLRIIDASVLPHVTVANTMAPTIVVAETGTDFLLADLDSTAATPTQGLSAPEATPAVTDVAARQTMNTRISANGEHA